MPLIVLLAVLVVAGCGNVASHGVGMVAAAQADGQSADRKVIQTVHLEVRVDSIQALAPQISAAVAQSKGYVADSYVSQAAHSGEWTVRIPNDELPSFLEVAQRWGVMLSQRATAEDVTEQFIDVTARLTAKRVEEERLLTLLKEGTGTLTDVLAVEQQLQRVRQEIEQAQGRIKFLENATTYATVRILAHELFGVSWSDGQPLSVQIGTTFRSSLNVMLFVGRGLIVILAALIPWFIVASIPVTVAWRFLRRRPHPARTHRTA